MWRGSHLGKTEHRDTLVYEEELKSGLCRDVSTQIHELHPEGCALLVNGHRILLVQAQTLCKAVNCFSGSRRYRLREGKFRNEATSYTSRQFISSRQ